ncbi:DUF3027 domain-containing protein [Nocardia sp. NPDC057353]|uniref:DUF3027 domain-containing protein n=1 Tax=Nocardia sp. NPDC057353 TaxID=3346104 RepID=UPI0036447757
MSAVSVTEAGVRPLLADAVELARRALLELEPSGVGEHIGVSSEDEAAATHRFEATLPGYRGWQWAVVVAAAPGDDRVTVSESALLPGPDALVAPDFVPWDQRVRPGDLGPGDLLPPTANDPRLVPGYVLNGDPAVDEVARDIGLGRPRVLSLEGREEAAERWFGEFGPDAEMARAAPSTCGLCGFYLPLAGAMRAAFGVCGNAMGADGRVVHNRYGCGAHSDTELPAGGGSARYEAYDDAAVEIVTIAPAKVESGAAEQAGAGPVAAQVESAGAESVGVESVDAPPVAADLGDTALATAESAVAQSTAAEPACVEPGAAETGAAPAADADAAPASAPVAEGESIAADGSAVAPALTPGEAEKAAEPGPWS